MILNVKINKDVFKKIGFGDATIFMNYPYLCENGRFTISAWGVDFNPRDVAFNYKQEGDIFVNGTTKITFTGIVSVDYSVRPYIDEAGIDFISSHDDKPIYHKKLWEIAEQNTGLKNNYYISCVVDFPFGFCELNIKSTGPVIIETDDADFIRMEEYLKAPQHFAYKK